MTVAAMPLVFALVEKLEQLWANHIAFEASVSPSGQLDGWTRGL